MLGDKSDIGFGTERVAGRPWNPTFSNKQSKTVSASNTLIFCVFLYVCRCWINRTNPGWLSYFRSIVFVYIHCSQESSLRLHLCISHSSNVDIDPHKCIVLECLAYAWCQATWMSSASYYIYKHVYLSFPWNGALVPMMCIHYYWSYLI